MEVFFAREAFAGREFLEGVGHEVRLLVDPLRHVLLPLRYRAVRVVGVAVGLRVGIYPVAGVVAACLLEPMPPVRYAVVAFLHVVVEHGVEEELATKAVADNHVDGPFAVGNLAVGVAAEADAVAVEPLYPGKQLCPFIGDESRVERLVEIDAVATVDDLQSLQLGVVTRSEKVVVHEHQLVTAFDGNLVHVHIGDDGTFLARHDAPSALVRAASRQEAVGCVRGDGGVDAVVGLEAVDLVRQTALDVVACAATDDFVGVVARQVVGREVEHLRHVDAVVVLRCESPLHLVALLLVIAADLAESEVGIDGCAPFLLLGVSVHVNESYLHGFVA